MVMPVTFELLSFASSEIIFIMPTLPPPKTKSTPFFESNALLSKKGVDFVFGGGNVGIMKIISDEAKDNNSKVTGITMESLHNLELKVMKRFHGYAGYF